MLTGGSPMRSVVRCPALDTQYRWEAFGVVVMSPAFDDDLGLTQRVEDFAVEQFVRCPAGDLQRKSAERGATAR